MCSSNPQNLTCVYCKAKISGHENSFLENHLWQPKPRDCCSVGRSLKFSHNVKIKSPGLVSTQKVDQLMPEKESTHSFNKAVNKQLAYAQLENRLIVVSCGFDQQLCLVHHLLLLIYPLVLSAVLRVPPSPEKSQSVLLAMIGAPTGLPTASRLERPPDSAGHLTNQHPPTHSLGHWASTVHLHTMAVGHHGTL